MPEAIESKSFRAAARKNCISYLGFPIYVASIPELKKLALPTFRTQSPDGAVSQLFSTLVNMGTQIELIRAGLRMTDSKPVPGVSYDEFSGMSMSISGAVYFENARQYKDFADKIVTIGQTYGWAENTGLGQAVYRPMKNDLTNIDPTQAAVKGMVLGTVSDVMDAGTILDADSSNEKEYFAARDRYLGGSIFKTAAIQFYSNSPVSAQNNWGALGNNQETVPALKIDGTVVESANIAYMPTSINVTPQAFVADPTGFYPTRCDVSIQMANPLGGLFANVVAGKDAGVTSEVEGVTPAIPANLVSKYGEKH